MKHSSASDTAEMKARGYDPTSIAEAEDQANRGLATERLIQVIEAAFAGVTLGGGVGLGEAQGLDESAKAATRAAYRARDEKDDWRLIPAETLNHCHSSLSFFDAEGMRFHLPAFMLAELRRDFEFGVTFSLTHLSESSRSQFAVFSDAQRQAVREFLMHLSQDPEYSFWRAKIIHALQEFWTEPAATRKARNG